VLLIVEMAKAKEQPPISLTAFVATDPVQNMLRGFACDAVKCFDVV
jgi:hypothetical protein